MVVWRVELGKDELAFPVDVFAMSSGCFVVVNNVKTLEMPGQLVNLVLDGLHRVVDVGNGSRELLVGQQISVPLELGQDGSELGFEGPPGRVKSSLPAYQRSNVRDNPEAGSYKVMVTWS